MLTYSTAPRACGPASCNACTSACGPPKRWWYPHPTTAPSLTSTQPTSGLGLTNPSPPRASSSACCMYCTSTAGSYVIGQRLPFLPFPPAQPAPAVLLAPRPGGQWAPETVNSSHSLSQSDGKKRSSVAPHHVLHRYRP